MNQLELLELPPALYRPPDRVEPSLPVVTRPGVLPLGELHWETFERLCLRLAAQGPDARHAKLYGRPGQAQQGIDIYVRRSTGRYEVWQSKRYETFSALQIEKAVDKFVTGTWCSVSDTFTLCVRPPLRDTKQQDEIERQAVRLRALGIDFQPLDAEGFSERLKRHPEIIDDFFGRAWVMAFCGEDAARGLDERLDAEDAAELRLALGNLYRCHFEVWDSGGHLPATSLDGSRQVLPLVERHVEPDLLETIRISTVYAEPMPTRDSPEPWAPDERDQARRAVPSSRPRTETAKQRVPAFGWIGKHDRAVILGDAGSGKSTLLRVLALEILAEAPRNAAIQARWAGFLPVWLPFSFWTEGIASAPESRALKASLRRYLEELDAPEQVWPLVERALRDKRLLLLVDGLDEWTNEQAGHTALGLLRAFVEQQGVAAILTSRPLGFQRLAGLDDRWKIVELAPLSRPQQQELALRWFRHVGGSAADAGTPAERTAQRQANDFIAELHRTPPLANLAGIPLLLWGLIALRLSQARLPPSRFSAYEKLTDLILHSHPAKRREAALSRGGDRGLSPNTQDDALARLAFESLLHGEETALENTAAKATLMDFLAAELEYPRHECARASDAFLDIGSDAAGILIRKSSRHLGFMHRAFLEFLAAQHIARLDLAEQCGLVGRYCRDPRWFDAILTLVHLTRRATDIERLVQAIEGADDDPLGTPIRQRLLAELAFGAFALPVKLAKRLAEAAFTEIETGTWMPLRRALLMLAVDGLHADSLRSLVQERICRWFPDRHPYRSSIYEAMEKWPRAPETYSCLWHGLHGTDGGDRRVAAIALAKVYGGDPEVEAQIKCLLHTAADPDLHAAALDALALGWPQANGIEQLIADARASIHPALRLVAIRALIAAGRQIDKDRDDLIALALGGSGLHWECRKELADALVAGWHGDESIKMRCLDSWSPKAGEYWDEIERDIASRVLLIGYASDVGVIDRLALLFEEEKHVSVMVDHGAIGLLPNIYPNASKRLETAIERWFPKQEYGVFETAHAALAIRTETAKQHLLRMLANPTSRNGWFVSVLLDGWGMGDKDIFDALTNLARGKEVAALTVAARLPEVLLDRVECRQRLLDLARHPSTQDRLDLIGAGFRRLGIEESDQEVMTELLDKDFECERRWFTANLSALMLFFPREPRVRELAERELSRTRDSFISSVAYAYADDRKMRCAIGSALTPLPASLRQTLAERLSMLAPEESFAQAVLCAYDQEHDGAASTCAAIGYYEAIVHRRLDFQAEIERLSQGLNSGGLARESAQHAAFAGVLTLDRLDIFMNLEPRYDDQPVRIALYPHLDDKSALLRHIAKHWDRVKLAFSGAAWQRLEGIGESGLASYKLIASHASEGTLLAQDIVERLEAGDAEAYSGSELLLYARARPGTVKLKEVCLRTIAVSYARMDQVRVDSAITAAEIVGSQFSDDADLRCELEKRLRTSRGEDVFAAVAICCGWPGSEVIAEVVGWHRERQYRVSYPILFYLSGDQFDAEEFVERTMMIVEDMPRRGWEQASRCVTPIMRRLRADESARAGLFARLRETQSPTAKSTFPGLLTAASGLDEDLREWCRAELARQFSREGIPEHGFSLSDGIVRPVAHVLMELLEPIGQ